MVRSCTREVVKQTQDSLDTQFSPLLMPEQWSAHLGVSQTLLLRFQHYTCSHQASNICLGKAEIATDIPVHWKCLGVSRRAFMNVDCLVG